MTTPSTTPVPSSSTAGSSAPTPQPGGSVTPAPTGLTTAEREQIYTW